MPSSDSGSDSEYAALSRATKARIDSAFDAVRPEDDENGASSSEPRIHISVVPDALAILDLPGDDEQILDVYRNAARRSMLGRKEWRKVCGALLGGEDAEEEEDAEGDEAGMDVDKDENFGASGGGGFLPNDDSMNSGGFLREDAGAGGFIPETGGGGFIPDDTNYDDEDHDALVESSLSDSSDEYVEPSSNKKSKKRARKSPATTPSTRNTRRKRARLASSAAGSDSDSDSAPSSKKSLTPSQKEHCSHVFSLFFDKDGDTDLSKKRIMIKDVQIVAKVLGEKLKAEEIIEMLEMFSSSRDKSMGLEDFQRMMVATKMISRLS